ncbi:redoxin domain-containing protein [Candidatus Puniceispirillum sp.]|nr:redoxin domain-containing protein [Candidatus Puniceispirillum sp.]
MAKKWSYFFPRADASGCPKEAVQFSALGDAFAEENTAVIGISKDRPARLAKFQKPPRKIQYLSVDCRRERLG